MDAPWERLHNLCNSLQVNKLIVHGLTFSLFQFVFRNDQLGSCSTENVDNKVAEDSRTFRTAIIPNVRCFMEPVVGFTMEDSHDFTCQFSDESDKAEPKMQFAWKLAVCNHVTNFLIMLVKNIF